MGSNGHLELDFAIDRTGNIAPAHAAAYAAFGAWQRACYGTALASGAIPAGGGDSVVVSLPVNPQTGSCTLDRVAMVEGASARGGGGELT